MEQSVEIAPEFGSSALRSSLFIIFVSCCKYKFDFCKVKSVLASENDIFVDGSARRRRGRPGTGRSCVLHGQPFYFILKRDRNTGRSVLFLCQQVIRLARRIPPVLCTRF